MFINVIINNSVGEGMSVNVFEMILNVFEMGLNVSSDFGQQLPYQAQTAWLLR